MPYNYLINPSIRNSLNFDFSNAVVIIDEAHNILQASEDSFSIDLSIATLKTALKDLHFLSEKK